MKLISLLLGFLFGAMPLVFAQQEDLRNDEDFFQSRVPFYQRWMDQSAIGEVFSIQELRVTENNLTLFLRFNYSNLDSMMNAWEALRQKFEREMPVSLEEQLYYKLVNIMDIPDGIGYVVIYDSYDPTVEPLFMRGIYFENGEVQTRVENPMSEIREISIRLSDISGSSIRSTDSFQVPGNDNKSKTGSLSVPVSISRQAVYSAILAFAREKYEVKNCDNRTPEVSVRENERVLRFEVTDLCKEVLKDEENPWLCNWLNQFGYTCNWIKREILEFQITCTEKPDGFDLSIIVDGKVGSGLHSKVKRKGYLPMEEDFDDYLKRYADQFREELRLYFLAKN